MATKLFFDLETLPDLREGAKERVKAMMKAPATHKKPETIAAWIEENADDAWRKTSFDGGYGAICVIGYAFDDEPVKTIICDDEASGIDIFLDEIHAAREADHFAGMEFIGHNVIGFDLPFIWKRAVINKLPHAIFPKDARHGTGKVFDTMVAWAGFKDRISLDNLAGILGLPSHKGEMDGSMVCDAWLAGKQVEIAAYCAKDVELTRSIYKAIS